MKISEAGVFEILENICDPEIPVLSVMDLGIVRNVEISDDDIKVFLTPTYNGCPAFDVIKMNIRMELQMAGFHSIVIEEVLSPPWTTDWISEGGKMKMKNFGISPPVGRANGEEPEKTKVPCPKCGSVSTEIISFFGSTACKAMYRCKDCLEPFDYFKCH